MLALTEAPPARFQNTLKPEINIATPEEIECLELECIAETIRDFSILEEDDFKNLFDINRPFSAREQAIFEPGYFQREYSSDFPNNLLIMNHLTHSPNMDTGQSLHEALSGLIKSNGGEVVAEDLHVTADNKGLILQHGHDALPARSALLSRDTIIIPHTTDSSYHAANGHNFEVGPTVKYDHDQYVGLSAALTEELRILAN